MTKNQNLQDVFLNQARGAKQLLTVFLVNGFQLRGVVTGFDSFTVVLDSEGKQQLIYKHAISTIIPARPINLSSERTEQETAE
jgi:host factor-I protein